jgi:WD40 repeat protein
MLVSAAKDMTVRFWNASSGAELRSYQGTKHYSKSVVFSPDGKIVAAASCGGITLLDPSTGKALRTIRKKMGCFDHVAFFA